MKAIKPYTQIFGEINGQEILQKIERIGRTCYKSEDKIKEDSAEKFVSNLIKRGHEAMLEHGTFIFETSQEFFYGTLWRTQELEKHEGFVSFLRFTSETKYIISGNVRAWRDYFKAVLKAFGCFPYETKQFIKDNPIIFPEFQKVKFRNRGDSLKPLTVNDLISENEKLTHCDVTVKFVVDRGISHEIVRHRVASFAQESTRYCNYAKDDFGNEVTVILPNYLEVGTKPYRIWVNSMQVAEDSYFALLGEGLPPEQARAVLPVSLKTEIVMTANLREWRHFFKLRAVGVTGKPHPQMLEVATSLLDLMQKTIPIVFDDLEMEVK